MKSVLSFLIFAAVLALVASAAVFPEVGVLYNVSHFAAWLMVGVVTLYAWGIHELEETIKSGGPLLAGNAKIAERLKKRTKLRKFYGAFITFAMAFAIAASGWWVAATLYVLLGLAVQGGALKVQELLQAKAARDADV